MDRCGDNYDFPENEFSYTLHSQEPTLIKGVIPFGKHPDVANLRIITDGSFDLDITNLQVRYVKIQMFSRWVIICLLAFCLCFILLSVIKIMGMINGGYNDIMQSRKRYIDIARVSALLLVSWGHFVGVGTNASDIQGVIAPGMISGTLLPKSEHRMWVLEEYMYSKFGVEFAVIGVVIFFISSGFFIPQMQKKYNGDGKEGVLIHSIKKTYPMLILTVILNGVLAFLSSDIRYSLKQYVATALNIALPTGIVSTMGVLWYLEVLFLVYLVATFFKIFDIKDVIIMYSVLLLIIVSGSVVTSVPEGWVLRNMSYLVSYAGIALIGVMFCLVKNYRIITKITYMLVAFLMTLYNIILYNSLTGVSSTYMSINTYLFAILLFIIAFVISCVLEKHSIPIIYYIIDKIGNGFLPFYLLHVHFGITAIWIMRQYGFNPYISVLVAYVFSAGVTFVALSIIRCFRRLVVKEYALIFKTRG